MAELVLEARFPFGRYAAVPWFRSRRETTGNVEWPPSPWRIARALVAAAYSNGGDDLVDSTVHLVRRLAERLPTYGLPPSSEVVYFQWMPQLAFDDSPAAADRSDNGHTQLAVDPDATLAIRWTGVELSDVERDLLSTLTRSVRYLGQSVAVCELRLGRTFDQGRRSLAAPVGPNEPSSLPYGEGRVVSLLVPEPRITREQLELATTAGGVKAMPAPPGTRWVEYAVRSPRPRPHRREPFVHGVIYRLDGHHRPGRASADELARRHPGLSLARLVRRALLRQIGDEDVRLIDDDGDGRAERLCVRLSPPVPLARASSVLAPPRPLTGPGIECRMVAERIDWDPHDAEPARQPGPLAFRMTSRALPPLADAVVVAETFRRRLLGVAGRRLGADRIPPHLSGKHPDGRPLQNGHRHLHVLVVASSSGDRADTLVVWAPDGFSRDEREIIRGTSLPMLRGTPIRLEPAEPALLLGPTRRWVSHTPFLPPRHTRRRGGRLVPTVAQQVVEELARRGLPEPVEVEDASGPWRAFRMLRREKAGAQPSLGAHGLALTFADTVTGPICLGRNSHFGMGLFLPT